jgi:alkylation response protein AidB-like acyl-CoA dehydrogenase
MVRAFLESEALSEYPQLLDAGRPSVLGGAALGILGIGVPEQVGGLPGSDYRHSAVVTEEIQALGMAIGGRRRATLTGIVTGHAAITSVSSDQRYPIKTLAFSMYMVCKRPFTLCHQ